MPTFGLSIAFFTFSLVTGILYLKQKKTLEALRSLKVIPIIEAKEGDVGIFQGEIGGTSVKVPYFEMPVAYYSFEIMEQTEKRVQNGQTQKTWKLVKKGESRTPFLVVENNHSILVNPTRFSVSEIELYKGKAVGLNKDIFSAMQFITEGSLRPDLMTKKLKLRISGLPIGRKVTVIGELENEAGTLVIKKINHVGKLYATLDVKEITKKEQTMVTVFIGLTIVLAVIAVGVLISDFV